MLTIHNLSKSFGITPLLENITFSVNAGERVGLIGPNGSGKSTLMRLVMGQEQPDSGHIAFTPSDLRVGYLAQGFEPDPHKTIAQILHETVGDPEKLDAELAHLAEQLAYAPQDAALQAAYDNVLARLSSLDVNRIQSLLAAFDLDTVDEQLPAGVLSGGQKTRLSLVLLLISQPQLLLLDEPTNHLDIDMLEWLETWLADFKGGVLLVSHDRTFLDRTVNRILELNPETHTIRAYPGNYSDYLAQYLLEREKQWQTYRDQEYEIRRMKQDIARTREQSLSVERSTTPRQPNVRRLAKKVMKKAKSREKKLERYLDSDDRVEKPSRSWQMKLDLDETPHLGKDVLTLDNLSVGYTPASPLLQEVSLTVQAGERIILTGANGTGKTTLLRTLTGEIRPLAGTYQLGASVQLGYMSQEQELLPPEQTALSLIQAIAPGNETEIRSFLHYFLFTGDDPLRPVANLSFGERARLSLAKLVASGCNLLVLDEPINHLDIPSRTMFEEALAQFDGTILAVVHDRYFIDRFATEIWFVDENGLRVELR